MNFLVVPRVVDCGSLHKIEAKINLLVQLKERLKSSLIILHSKRAMETYLQWGSVSGTQVRSVNYQTISVTRGTICMQVRSVEYQTISVTRSTIRMHRFVPRSQRIINYHAFVFHRTSVHSRLRIASGERKSSPPHSQRRRIVQNTTTQVGLHAPQLDWSRLTAIVDALSVQACLYGIQDIY